MVLETFCLFSWCLFLGPACIPGYKWKEDCHSCFCTEDGKVACTKEACPPQLVPRNMRSVNRQTCTEGERWKEDCHSCYCSWGKPACTRELCESEATYTVATPPADYSQQKTKRDAVCKEDEVWKEDCHTCHCSYGRKACTRELCFSESNLKVTVSDEDNERTKRDADDSGESSEEEKCPPGKSEWEEDCNKCYCGDDGLKVCSRALCPNQGPVVAIKPKQ